MTARILLSLLALVLAGCHDDGSKAPVPPPQALSGAAIAQFCGMSLQEHPGPKGQMFLRDQAKPLWFASVRDAVAFTMLPEMPKDVAVLYVTDMARAGDWEHPETATWVDARKALYVIDSERRGGMGTTEAVPFSQRPAADEFAAANGGRVVDFAHIPQSYVLGSDRDGS